MKKYLSFTAMFFALLTISVAQSMPSVEQQVNNSPAGDLIKFLVPIVAGLLGKLIDKWFEKKKNP
jgi:hypothetical protein